MVLFDYDEISYLIEVNFRKTPEPWTYGEEMACEPSYTIAAEDVFLKKFATLQGDRSKPTSEKSCGNGSKGTI